MLPAQKPVQLESAAHVARQARPAASHWYAPQDVSAPGLQVPEPLQVDGACAVALEQLAARHWVPATCFRQAPAPSQVPSSPQVDGLLAPHSSRGLVPGSAALHVPRLFVAAQVLQLPVQAVLQQTPSTQKPLPQSPATAQAVPFASRGTQVPAAQWVPAVQSAFEPHVAAHPEAPHMNAPHDMVFGIWQMPAPLQVLAGWYVEPEQEAAVHTVPSVHLRQAPPPSHCPSRPQVAVSSGAHSLSGSVPPTTARQRPSAAAVLAAAQAKQPPAQVLSQQTPSTQLLLPHSTDAVQAVPCGFNVAHTVPAQ